jgi:hypothetical protein
VWSGGCGRVWGGGLGWGWGGGGGRFFLLLFIRDEIGG